MKKMFCLEKKSKYFSIIFLHHPKLSIFSFFQELHCSNFNRFIYLFIIYFIYLWIFIQDSLFSSQGELLSMRVVHSAPVWQGIFEVHAGDLRRMVHQIHTGCWVRVHLNDHKNMKSITAFVSFFYVFIDNLLISDRQLGCVWIFEEP